MHPPSSRIVTPRAARQEKVTTVWPVALVSQERIVVRALEIACSDPARLIAQNTTAP